MCTAAAPNPQFPHADSPLFTTGFSHECPFRRIGSRRRHRCRTQKPCALLIGDLQFVRQWRQWIASCGIPSCLSDACFAITTRPQPLRPSAGSTPQLRSLPRYPAWKECSCTPFAGRRQCTAAEVLSYARSAAASSAFAYRPPRRRRRQAASRTPPARGPRYAGTRRGMKAGGGIPHWS